MNETTPSILLIEEDVTLRQIIAFRLELLGMEVVAVGTGRDALKWMLDKLPRVILVGNSLPDMGGLELVDRLSNELRTSEVPVMLLSPNAELEDVQKAFNAGADEYLVTPFDPQVLEKKLRRLTTATLT